MRHLLANIVTYVIAFLLIAGAALFAWARSAQLALTNESIVLARFDPDVTPTFEWRELGGSSYERNCLNCHGTEGQGWDQYPGLAHTGRLLEASGGREYLIDLHLYGLTSDRWRAPMPPMGHLQDVELAAVLDYIAERFGGIAGEQPPFLPRDIRARRGLGLSPPEVNRTRPDVGTPMR
jgi:mono/diheme cytochrome c family protein